eukprot:TRINITY_DN2309_c0_g1_i1.p1 TRINITY_DN2309_c0_g1~~TRINITY_DN2309_c0_g1_i1.p1  ORF type:complete len:351 (+),score=33.71 TRINITY_DN2309_c0_g1_i1:52-1053(+)
MSLLVALKYKKDVIEVELSETATLGDLQDAVFLRTRILPVRQKLLGLYKGKKPAPETKLAALGLGVSNAKKLMLMGTPEADIAVTFPEDATVINDFDVGNDDDVDIKDQAVYLNKIEARIHDYSPKVINPSRPGKKLLVLDVDYTFFDHRSPAGDPLALRRPFIEHMLTMVYPYYDIMIWSATSMKWIETKMQLMQLDQHKDFKITAYFDHYAMITISHETYGVYNTKPLPVVWALYPQYSAENTIMFDDLRRNFIMNPGNGLKIRPFRSSVTAIHTDKELYHLTNYLLLLIEEPNLSLLRHSVRFLPCVHLFLPHCRSGNATWKRGFTKLRL